MLDLPPAIAMMVEHAQKDFEKNKKLSRITAEWEADYQSLMSFFALVQIAWHETVNESACWHLIKEHIITRWTQYIDKHAVGFSKSEHIEIFAELHDEEAHNWSEQHIAQYLTAQGIDVGRHQVWRILHKRKH